MSVLYNPATKSGLRWVENVSQGLRFVGYADEVCRSIDHRGWYIDDMQSDTYRGIVYRLPARKGKPRFVYGYADPFNSDCALLCFEVTECEEDAARFADSMAERDAEKERDYQEAWQAGQQYQTALDGLQTEKEAARELHAAMKKERHKNPAPVICQALREKVLSHLQSARKWRKEAAELWGEYEHLRSPANYWRKNLWEAFADGAGLRVDMRDVTC